MQLNILNCFPIKWILKTPKKNQNPNPSLPEDVIYVILLRLPVRFLLRLRSVCKSWLSLISSRDFIKTHLSLSTNDPHFTRHHLILGNWRCVDGYDFSTCSLYSLLNESVAHTLNLDYPRRLNYPHDIKRVVGYCNGLICLASDVHVFFWNPSTRKIRRLPTISSICARTKYGFCYDDSDNDFKVFAIFGRRYECKASIYSTKSDSWRMIGNFPFGEALTGGEFANGAVHWVVSPKMQKKAIVSLDVKTETYREVMQPKYGEGVYTWTLGTFGQSLIIISEYDNIRYDFWVMKECGVEVSWTKLFTIPYNMDELRTRYPNPICILRNGDILLNLYSAIVLYNTQHNTFEDLLNFHFRELHVYTYVESLVSPHSQKAELQPAGNK